MGRGGKRAEQLALFKSASAPERRSEVETARAVDAPAPHTPVYLMHRYFARRPATVFAALVRRHSRPGDVVLDPFLGGGVTLVEGLHAGRRVIGVDLNPMAAFISRAQVLHVDVKALASAVRAARSGLKAALGGVDAATCPACAGHAEREWLEWSVACKCPGCGADVALARCDKVGPGAYRCACGGELAVLQTAPRPAVPMREKIHCSHCGHRAAVPVSPSSAAAAQQWERTGRELCRAQGLSYPEDPIFPGRSTGQVLRRGFRFFHELFSSRNLYALAKARAVFEEIAAGGDPAIRELLLLAFSSALFEVSRLAHIKGASAVKPGAHYWPSDIFAERNVARHLCQRLTRMLSGKRYAQRYLGAAAALPGTCAAVLAGDAAWTVLNASSTRLPLPDGSIDVCITDPPYGDYVNYSEMSDFWAVWLRDHLQLAAGPIERTEEAVINPAQEKTAERYRDLLAQVFKEVRRVLKPHGALVMTFNNKHYPAVWALMQATRAAGFLLPRDGVYFQPPIAAYKTTLNQQRAGSIHGDFVFRFLRAEQPETPERGATGAGEWTSVAVSRRAMALLAGGEASSLTELYARIIPELVAGGAFDGRPDGELRGLSAILEDAAAKARAIERRAE